MGASGWDYIQPFKDDAKTTMAALRQRIFDERDYYWSDSVPRPATLADWDAMCTKEPDPDDPDIEVLMEVIASGTASILDVRSVGSGRKYDVEPFAADDIPSLFGTPTPTRGDFERADLGSAVPDKWHGGYYVSLFDAAGEIEALGFWGASGD